MIIYELIDNEYVSYEITEDQCHEMVEKDYEMRVRELPQQAQYIKRRTPQEIFEELNAIEAINYRYAHRHISPVVVPKQDKDDGYEVSDGVDYMADPSWEMDCNVREALAECSEFKIKLTRYFDAGQVDMLMMVAIYREYTIQEYAALIGDKPNNVSHRFRRLLKKVQELMESGVL